MRFENWNWVGNCDWNWKTMWWDWCFISAPQWAPNVPIGWLGLSLRVACPHELGHFRSAPFVSTWKEVNKGSPSRPFALQRSSQLARNIKGDTPLVEHCHWMLWGWSNSILNDWNCVALIVLCAQWAQRKQLGQNALKRELGQNSDPLSNAPMSLFIHLSCLKRVKVHWKRIKIFLGTFES